MNRDRVVAVLRQSLTELHEKEFAQGLRREVNETTINQLATRLAQALVENYWKDHNRGPFADAGDPAVL